MKDLRPIEIQVAELNEEQKDNIVKLYKKQFNWTIVAMIVLIIAVGFFIGFRVVSAEAADEHEKIETSIALNEDSNTYNFELFEESMDALNRQYDFEQYSHLSLIIGGGVSLIFSGIALAIVSSGKKQMPYYSEKKYRYIKKMRKMAR